MKLLRIESLGDLRGKRVLLRVDFNVPLRDGRVADDYRLLMALPTIRRLRDLGARLVVCSHLGRPKGPDAKLSLGPVAKRLGELLEGEVRFVPHIVGPEAEAAAAALEDGQVLVLENLRFDPGEKQNDPAFAAALARLGDVFVSDAFGVCHRAEASTVGVTAHLPKAAGDLVATEIEKLTPLREGTAPKPFYVVLGGAKLADKIPVLEAFLPKVDGIFVGGAMAYTFLHAMQKPIGKSLLDESAVDDALRILEVAREAARDRGCELVLPIDHVVAKGPNDLDGFAVVDEIPSDVMGLDVGPATIAAFTKRLRGAKTVFWNGPLGMFECKPFHLGTHYMASVLGCTQSIKTVVGGGDSVAATRELGLEHTMDWISTGGGASLEYVQGVDLPGLKALEA